MWRPWMYVFLVFTALCGKTFAIDSVLECTEGECYGSWRKPYNCTYDCKYEVGWCVGSEEVTVKVNAATDDDGWIGIGFSESMTNISDIVIAGITSDNDTFIDDRWLIGNGIPQHDTSQDITNASADISDGITTMIFTRSRITGDTDHDIELHCQSIFFAWGREAISDNDTIKALKPRFEEISDDDICFCPTSTVGVTPMLSSKLTPTMPTVMPTPIPTPMPIPISTPMPSLCPSCTAILNNCSLNATCKVLLDEEREHCRNILEWDEFSNETEPVCTEKCKEKLVALVKSFGKEISCCKCGEITDDHKLNDITSILRCHRIQENIGRWCPNTFNTSCHECEQGSYVIARCLDVINTCMQDDTCKRLMNDMERKCKNVHVWNEYSKSDPTCSENCFQAIFELIRNPIGNLWSYCDCHVPHTQAQGTFPSLSRNSAFEEQCFQYQRNRHTFCFHEYSCKGQQFSCQWLTDVCTKDPTCKQLYDNWNEKCVALINRTADSKTLPICTDECKKANNDFKKHKIWRRSTDCHCGRFDDNAELKDIRQTEKCFRQRLMFLFCGERTLSVECPEDPCEPETCSTAYKKCSESDSCKRLYEDWEEKCIAVWESTTENCSTECKNVTVELYSDLYGQHLRGCDCGMRDLSLYPLLPEEVKCFECQIKMEEVCNIDDTKRCQNCKAEKVCSHSCDKVRSICTNNTDCNMIWNKYNTYCDGVISWDGNSTIPMCTDECKRWIKELENNLIGKYIKCCHCNKENEVECIRERRNVAIVCDVDFNHVKDCHNNEELCINDTLKNYEGNKDSDGQEHHTMDGSSLTACSGWREKCIDDKCCRKAFHDTIYLCDSIYSWENISRTNTAPPTCSDRCANALGILYSDHIGQNLRCCTCKKFSDIDQNNLSVLKATERCYAGRINLENICKISHSSGCNKLPDTFEDPCAVDSCQNALSSCKNNDTCERLYANFVNKCNSVLLPNSTDPVCSHDCKQAIDNLYTNHIGFKLKCCDCGSLRRQNHMIAAHIPQSPDQCHVERFRLIDICAVNHDECIDCKHKATVVCPQPCSVAREQCNNNSDCHKLLNMFYMECQDLLILDANSSKCTDRCRALLKSRKLHFPEIEFLDCCICDDDNCSIQKRNMETLCDIKLDSAEECQNKRTACEEYNRPKLDHRDQCPPRMCDDSFQRCKDDKLCTRFHNDVHFYCRNVLEWQDDQVEPICISVCQMAIDKLALVTTRTMGYNIMCCTCGNYSDIRGNNLIAIRDWENCRRRTRNIKQFCKHNCTDCDKIRPPRQMASCKLTTRLCNEISECKTMKDKIDALCSNVFTWERNTNKHPHCSSECKQAWSTMISSSYGRLLCCDCHHNDMTAREKRQCEQQHRNFKEICNLGMEGMCSDTCNNNQQNKSEALDDCFDHVERCNRDVQCSGHLFNYTNQCAMAFSGKQMTPDQENVCEEAARKLFTYKQFGENFMNCECSAYPELCKELFKNRFLLDKSCSEALDKCRTNATCNKLLNDHNSCMLTDNSCSQTCMIKAVLLYRHRFGKAWWKACSPHYFEQVCFKLY